MASELLGQPPLAHPAEAGGCHVSLHLPLTYLLQATHIVQWLYYLLPSCKTRVGSSSPMAKGVQAPFLALVKSRMAHDGVVSSVLQTYHYDLLQPEELCDLMLVLPIKTKHEL